MWKSRLQGDIDLLLPQLDPQHTLSDGLIEIAIIRIIYMRIFIPLGFLVNKSSALFDNGRLPNTFLKKKTK